jgi:hypothetical protein
VFVVQKHAEAEQEQHRLCHVSFHTLSLLAVPLAHRVSSALRPCSEPIAFVNITGLKRTTVKVGESLGFAATNT